MTPALDNLIDNWEKAERLVADHEQCAKYTGEWRDAWQKDEPFISDLYRQLNIHHSFQRNLCWGKAASLRHKLVEALMATVPKGADLVVQYRQYLDENGCFTYSQYLDAIKEQGFDAANVLPDPSPF